MAHIQINSPHPDKGFPATQIVINGNDFSDEIYAGVELVAVGADTEFAQVGLRVTFAVGRLDLGEDADIQVTDHLRTVAQRVRSTQRGDAAGVATAFAPGGLPDLPSIYAAQAAELKKLRDEIRALRKEQTARNARRR